MTARLRIAAAVWGLSLALAIPAAIATVFVRLMTANFGGVPGQSDDFGPFLFVFVIAAVSAVTVTIALRKFVARESNGEIHAGPVVIGCGAGLLLGSAAALWALLGGYGIVLGATVLPFGGSVAGSLVRQPIPSPVVGVIAGALAVFAATILF